MRLFSAVLICGIFLGSGTTPCAGGEQSAAQFPEIDTPAGGFLQPLSAGSGYAVPGLFTPSYVLWSDGYNHNGDGRDETAAVAVSPDGLVWVTGMVESPGTGYDIHTIIYDTDGTVVNSMSWDGDAHGDDIPVDLLLDQGGNCYVAGQTWNDGNEEDIVLIAYDAAGTFLWDSHFTGSGGGPDIPSELALDATGRIGMIGTTYSGLFEGGNDYVTLIWDDSGTPQCENIFNGDLFLGDFGISVTFDSAGNCIVSGHAIHGFSQYDITALKYDSSCSELLEIRYEGGIYEGDYTVKVGVDSQDNVIICGYSRSGTSNRDYLILKYTAAGDLIWDERYNGPKYDEDYTTDMVIGPEDNIYVTGRSRGLSYDYDIATVKLAPDGTREWARRFKSLGRGDDEGRSILLDAGGNVYVTGTMFDVFEGGTDIVTLKYDTEGTLLWVRTLDGAGRGDDFPAALTLDGTEALYLTGTSYEGTGSGFDFRTVKQLP